MAALDLHTQSLLIVTMSRLAMAIYAMLTL
jgi:hypothetical protein